MRGGPTVDVAAMTHVGLARQRNEDCAVVAGTVLQAEHDRIEWSGDGEPVLLAVLDGLGGHPDGDVASRLAGEALASVDDPTDVRGAVVAAHAAVLDGVDDGLGRRDMGATVVAAAITTGEIMVGAAGDSLALRVHSDMLELLNEPDRGSWGALTSFAGDALSGGFEPHVRRIDRDDDVRLLLSTDGLTDVVPPEEIHALAREGTPARAAQALVDATLEHGARDNVTVLVADIAAD